MEKTIEFFHIFFLLLSISTNIIYESRIVLDSISGQRFTFSSNHVSSNLINKPNECLKRLTYCSTVSIYRASIPSNIVNINLSQIFGRFSPSPSRWRISFAIARETTTPHASSSTLFTPKLRNYVIKLHPQRVGGAEIELIAVNLQNGLAEKLERTNSRNTRPRGENPFAGVSICIGQRVVFLTRSLPSPFIHFRSLCLPLSRALLVHDFSGFHASKVGFAGD